MRIWVGWNFRKGRGESDKADDRMRTLAIAHKKIVIERLSTLCAEAKVPEPEMVAHTIGLIMDGAIVMALITRDSSAADVAARACAAVIPRQISIRSCRFAGCPYAPLKQKW